MSTLYPDRRLYFSFPLSGNFERGVLLDKTRYTDNTVISYYYKERYRPLPQNTRRDYHKTLDETTTKHSITTTTKHSITKTAKSGVVTGLKGIFRGCNMYTYMYCMYRIERHNSRRHSYERRLYAQYVRRPASFFFCGFMERPEYLGGVGEILAR